MNGETRVSCERSEGGKNNVRMHERTARTPLQVLHYLSGKDRSLFYAGPAFRAPYCSGCAPARGCIKTVIDALIRNARKLPDQLYQSLT